MILRDLVPARIMVMAALGTAEPHFAMSLAGIWSGSSAPREILIPPPP